MTETELLELAKQGRPNAIAALIDRSLRPKGISTKVSLKQGCLKVILCAPNKVPNKKLLADFIYQGTLALELTSISSLKVYGIKTGNRTPAWLKEFKLAPHSNGRATPIGEIATGSDRLDASPNPPPTTTGSKSPGKAVSTAAPTTRLKSRKAQTQKTSRSTVVEETPESTSTDLSSSVTAEHYEELLRDRVMLPPRGKWGLDYYVAIPQLAKALVEFPPAKGEIFSAIGVRYQGELAFLVLTKRHLSCFIFPEFSSKPFKRFALNFNKISRIVATQKGLIIHRKNGLKLRIYFSHPKLARKFIEEELSKFIDIESGRWMAADRYEISLTLFGYLTILLAVGVNLIGLFWVVKVCLETLLGTLS